MFIGNGHLTIDPWIWLKTTFLSSTASVLKDGRLLLEIPSFSQIFLFFLKHQNKVILAISSLN
jgi:hypothetical protein